MVVAVSLLCVLVLPQSVNAQQGTQKADMVNPRLFFSVVAVEKEIYVVGGMLAAPNMTRTRTPGRKKQVCRPLEQHLL